MTASVIRSCPSCAKKNRVPAAKLAVQGRCGACGAALPPLSEPLDVGSDLFDEIVKSSEVPVLVDFWAQWCGPCRMAAPVVKQVAQETSGRALVLKVNTESSPDLAQRFQVRAIPNFVVMRRGEVVAQQPGLADAHTMRQWLEQAGA